MNIDEKVYYLLKTVGIPAHYEGYEYLAYAIKVAYCEPSVLKAVTKELYPAVAKQFASTPTKVERAMRYAIEHIFDNTPMHILTKVFGNSIDRSSGKVTNMQFICTVIELLKHEPNNPIFTYGGVA